MSLDRAVSPSSFGDDRSIDNASKRCSAEEKEASIAGAGTMTGTPDSAAAAATATAVPEDVIPKPKRPLSAYNLFFRDQREMLIKTLPARQSKHLGKGHGKIGFQDLARVIGAKWRDIDFQEKARYEEIAAEGREKYLEHTKLWKQQQQKKGLPTTRRKKKEKKSKVHSTSAFKKPSFGLHIQDISPRKITSFMNVGGLSSSSGTLSLPPIASVQGTTAGHQHFARNMGTRPRVVSGMANEIRPDNHAYVNEPAHHHVVFNETFDQRSGFSGLPEFRPSSSQFGFVSAEENSAYESSIMTFPAFHSLEGQKVEESEVVDPLPYTAPLPCDSFNEFLPSQPTMEVEPRQAYSRSHQNFDSLAELMGSDCVDLFVDLFGSSQGP